MALIPINSAGKVGIIDPTDFPSHELPLNAWTSGKNVRMKDGKVEKFLGHQQAFGNPGTAPYFALPLTVGSNFFWIYLSLTKAYAWDGATHTDITRASGGDYAATAIKNWTGDRLGIIPIFNNQIDVPQMWNPPELTGNLAALSNWDSTWRCGAMRSFRRFLVAMDVTKGSDRYQHMVKWSHPAPLNGVPVTWDAADETKDAGEYEITDSDEPVIDGARMRDFLVVYKGDAVHAMQYVGGVDVFRFPPLFDSFGILSRRCAVEYSRGKHAVFAVGDLIEHDAQNWRSIADRRLRNWIFNQIDPENYQMSYVALVPPKEVWFCFPTTGSSIPNMAAVWNWQENTLGVRDIEASHIATGNVALVSSSDIWDNDSGAWDSDPSVWGEGASNPAGRRILICNSADTKLHLGDSTQQFDGQSFESFIERVGLPLPVKPDGPPDMRSEKFISEIYPQILGTNGATIRVHFGKQSRINGPITWLAPRNFIIGESHKVEARFSTNLLAIRFEADSNIDWKLAGYEVDCRHTGRSRGQG